MRLYVVVTLLFIIGNSATNAADPPDLSDQILEEMRNIRELLQEDTEEQWMDQLPESARSEGGGGGGKSRFEDLKPSKLRDSKIEFQSGYLKGMNADLWAVSNTMGREKERQNDDVYDLRQLTRAFDSGTADAKDYSAKQLSEVMKTRDTVQENVSKVVSSGNFFYGLAGLVALEALIFAGQLGHWCYKRRGGDW